MEFLFLLLNKIPPPPSALLEKCERVMKVYKKKRRFKKVERTMVKQYGEK
jgi:hypothetical protein